MQERLRLPDVTLVMMTSVAHALSALVVKDCLDRADFGGVLIITDDPAPFGPAGRIVTGMPLGSMDEVMRCLWYEVPRYVATSHVLVVQWDSGIVDPAAWSDEFLEYDYVGAPWGWHGNDGLKVGNGGFSLRSKRLMDFVATHEALAPLENPEDIELCRSYRPWLEREGFRWAPIELAARFAVERTILVGDTLCAPKLAIQCRRQFGYHGIFNWSRVLDVPALFDRMTLARGSDYVRLRPDWREVEELAGHIALI